jgi:acyl-coenzyme A thioesterase PaaI-like protein
MTDQDPWFGRAADPGDARVQLAAATRRIIAELASSSATDDEFAAARELVEQAAAVLEGRPHGRHYIGAEASLGEFEPGSFIDFSPIVGAMNPLSPPVRMRLDTDGTTVVGDVVYGDAYEGPPGCAHGGFIAAGFDELLGFAQSRSGLPAMTGRLSVSYRSPTPLRQPVRYRGRIDRVEGRKILTSGTLHHGDVLCAEAEALFISVRPDTFTQMMQRRTEERSAT